jgi:hypothetical protein
LPSLPVPTRSDPSPSIRRSKGQSSAASHSVSQRPSGRIRKIAPLALRVFALPDEAPDEIPEEASTTVIAVISADTLGTGARGAVSGVVGTDGGA